MKMKTQKNPGIKRETKSEFLSTGTVIYRWKGDEEERWNDAEEEVLGSSLVTAGEQSSYRGTSAAHRLPGVSVAGFGTAT